MKIYAVNRQETYEKTYFIKAKSFEDAVERLNEEFECGGLLCPGMAEDAACYNEVSSDESNMFTEEFMESRIDINTEVDE